MNAAAKTEEFRRRLFENFPLTPVSGRKLQDGLKMDNWGRPPSDWPREEWRDWSDIPYELLHRGEYLLTYFDGPDLVYFLPAFLLQFLKEAQSPATIFSHPVDSLFIHLEKWRRESYRDISLTEDQRQLVEEIFAFGQEFPDLKSTVDAVS